MKYTLRPASDADRTWLDELRRVVYRDLFEATWGGWDEDRHRRHFDSTWSAGSISVIVVDGTPAGMIQILEDGRGVEIGEIQILPEVQNRGLGGRVISDVVTCAQARRKSMSLYLGLKNAGALRLYRRLGFREVGRSNTHIFMQLGSD